MKDWINYFIRLAHFMRHIFPVLWRRCNGRFHCWRDTPSWVLFDYVALPLDPNDEVLQDLKDQAHSEIQLRERKD